MSLVFVEDELKSAVMSERLRRIECPTLVLAGEKESVTPAADAEEIIAALPAGLGQFHRFANAGRHLFCDAPESFFETVRRFIMM